MFSQNYNSHSAHKGDKHPGRFTKERSKNFIIFLMEFSDM